MRLTVLSSECKMKNLCVNCIHLSFVKHLLHEEVLIVFCKILLILHEEDIKEI